LFRFLLCISETYLISFFTLRKEDRRFVKRHYGAIGQLGVALQLYALRFLGFIPDALESAPEAEISFLARQLEIPIEEPFEELCHGGVVGPARVLFLIVAVKNSMKRHRAQFAGVGDERGQRNGPCFFPDDQLIALGAERLFRARPSGIETTLVANSAMREVRVLPKPDSA
jgi:hypothetical protein